VNGKKKKKNENDAGTGQEKELQAGGVGACVLVCGREREKGDKRVLEGNVGYHEEGRGRAGITGGVGGREKKPTSFIGLGRRGTEAHQSKRTNITKKRS